MLKLELGGSIPPDTAHAVSVSLPTWEANVGYEEGEEWVVSRMTTGYPRFFIHKSISAFAQDLAAKYGLPGQVAMLFPTRDAACRCVRFMNEHQAPSPSRDRPDVVHLSLDRSAAVDHLRPLGLALSAVLCAPASFPFAKQYWQHTGDGVSSRRAEFCHGLFKAGLLVRDPTLTPPAAQKRCKGPRRYQRPVSVDAARGHGLVSAPRPVSPPPTGDSAGVAGTDNSATITQPGQSEVEEETSLFLEERFGRNLDISLFSRARSAIKRRIAGTVTADLDIASQALPATTDRDSRGVGKLLEDDVFLFPCGMNAIFNAHRLLLAVRGSQKSVHFGFAYVDTLKILQKFGPGCVFYGHASDAELDNLEARLESGERFLALFCEFPANPLLTCPDLARIRTLADRYDFAVVVDETIGTFANVNVLQYADIVVSSLTKIFSGDCNVMGGSGILNPNGRYYGALKAASMAEWEDTYWAEDVLFLERNSRDFATRVDRINANAEAICDVLVAHPTVKTVFYPKINPSRDKYELCRRLPSGGYGGLLSVTFRHKEHAVAFYNALDTAKGPSLGTNFTLTSPYVLLAHYQELEWAAALGVEPDLIRISVGMEETAQLIDVFSKALDVAGAIAVKQ